MRASRIGADGCDLGGDDDKEREHHQGVHGLFHRGLDGCELEFLDQGCGSEGDDDEEEEDLDKWALVDGLGVGKQSQIDGQEEHLGGHEDECGSEEAGAVAAGEAGEDDDVVDTGGEQHHQESEEEAGVVCYEAGQDPDGWVA